MCLYIYIERGTRESTSTHAGSSTRRRRPGRRCRSGRPARPASAPPRASPRYGLNLPSPCLSRSLSLTMTSMPRLGRKSRSLNTPWSCRSTEVPRPLPRVLPISLSPALSLPPSLRARQVLHQWGGPGLSLSLSLAPSLSRSHSLSPSPLSLSLSLSPSLSFSLSPSLPLSLSPSLRALGSEAVPHVVPITPDTVKLMATLGALLPRGGPVHDPVLTGRVLHPQGWPR